MGGTFLIFFFLFNVENPILNLKGLYHPEKNGGGVMNCKAKLFG